MIAHRIDVRSIPTWLRHREIFAAFDALRPGESLELSTDHEPRPLRYEFDHQREGRFVWSAQQLADDDWSVTIRRLKSQGRDGSLADFFARCAAFEGAHPRTLAAFTAHAVERTVTRRESVNEQGALWPYLGVVREGTLGMIAGSANGRERLLFEYLPFETFGEIAVVDGGAALGRVAPPFGRARIVAIPRAAVLKQMEDDAAFARRMTLLCAHRGRALAERLELLAGRSTIERMARALLPYASPEQGISPALAPATRMSQSQLAVAAGTVREVAARALFELESAGAIELEGGRIARIDRAKLAVYL
ncbi:MAG TPA: DUF2249 domain-containing protein [Candidatus Dormibacteraeota bacterium]|nr:DUF2249 domain-containing protein [Candidatus Dormibacteraeota bacterium]